MNDCKHEWVIIALTSTRFPDGHLEATDRTERCQLCGAEQTMKIEAKKTDGPINSVYLAAAGADRRDPTDVEQDAALYRALKDCRVIGGIPQGVIISRDTAYEALKAMKFCAEQGRYKRLFADDASFVMASMDELERAAEPQTDGEP